MNIDVVVRLLAKQAANMYLVLQNMQIPAERLREEFGVYRRTLENYVAALAVCDYGPCRAMRDPAAFVAAFGVEATAECSRVPGVPRPCPVELGGWIMSCTFFIQALRTLTSIEMGLGDPGVDEENVAVRERGLITAVYSPFALSRVVAAYPSLLSPDEPIFRVPALRARFDEVFEAALAEGRQATTDLRVDLLGRDEVPDEPSG